MATSPFVEKSPITNILLDMKNTSKPQTVFSGLKRLYIENMLRKYSLHH